MTPSFLLICVLAYSAVLFFITYLTSRNATNETYFVGNRSSKWYLVAYGMIGASLSGVTFMSVPGGVGPQNFAYLQLVFGYLFGYGVITIVLLPLYYRLNLTSIYTYLQQRFGKWSYKTGAFYFILSRVIGASFRLYIVVNVLQLFVFDEWGIPFGVTVAAFIILILLYTFKGGVKTIVWTDTLQTTFMLLAVIITVYLIGKELNLSLMDMIVSIKNSSHSAIFVSDWNSKTFFLKHFFGGAFIAIAMTGLDQEMMQKNISCKTIKESQKNMITFTIILFFVNILFLGLGVLLYIYSAEKNIPIPAHTDDLFPTIAIKFLGPVSGLFFIIGLISAAFPSADGALTALTTSFCIDIIGIKDKNWSEQTQKQTRHIVHISFAVLLLLVIIYFKTYIDESVLNKLFTVANYTYGPLLGLFTFGLFTKLQVKDRFVPIMAIFPPVICYLLNNNLKNFFAPYQFGFEMLIINGTLTCIGLFILAKYGKSNANSTLPPKN